MSIKLLDIKKILTYPKMLGFDTIFCFVTWMKSKKKKKRYFTPMQLGFSSICGISDQKKKPGLHVNMRIMSYHIKSIYRLFKQYVVIQYLQED